MQSTSQPPVTVPDSGRAQRLHVVTGACSVKGTRRETNEDVEYISPDLDLFIVADGMGGHHAGEVASGSAVVVLPRDLPQSPSLAEEKEVEERVHKALDHARCLTLGPAAFVE